MKDPAPARIHGFQRPRGRRVGVLGRWTRGGGSAASLLALAAGIGPGVRAQEISTGKADLARLESLSLEDILNVEVTAPSKHPQRAFGSAGAVAVISEADIRRSGATSIPEALRLAPGMSVAQVSGGSWAVTARGMNEVYANRLLVLRDGRSLYSPVHSGVDWAIQDYVLEDLDRIEVVRGPGGALWGANAVNGVVNIVTRDAAETQGWLATGIVGTTARAGGAARYGFPVGSTGHARAYLKVQEWAEHPGGGSDDRDLVQGGFRSDFELEEGHLTVQGDLQYQELETRTGVPTFPPPGLDVRDERTRVGAGNALARWEKNLGMESTLQVQAYYDRVNQRVFGADQFQEMFDVEVQHRVAVPGRQEITYGAGYRYLPDQLDSTPLTSFNPEARHEQLFNGFVQDEIELVPDLLRGTLGAKAEYNGWTGWEFQPSARFAWTPSDRQTVWGAVSRAVQVPGRNLNDMSAVLPPFPGVPFLVTSSGNRELEAQGTLAYELGYRIRPTSRLAVDLALFLHDHDDMIAGNTAPPVFDPDPFPHLEARGPVNGGEGTTAGVELAASWDVLEDWRLALAYTFLESDFEDGALGFYKAGNDPQHQVSLRSSWDLPGSVSLDAWARYVGELEEPPGVDAYLDLDVRLAWRPREELELALVGQNLLEPERYEFNTSPYIYRPATPVPRGVYLQATLRF